jgi:hypothetical protein
MPNSELPAALMVIYGVAIGNGTKPRSITDFSI